MYNVDKNVVMAKWFNMWNVFSNFNKNNVMPAAGNMDRDGSWIFPQEKRVSKRGPKGKSFLGVNPNPYFWIYLSLGKTYISVWVCETQIIKLMQEGGCESHIPYLLESMGKKQSTLGRLSSQLSWGEWRKFVWIVTGSFYTRSLEWEAKEEGRKRALEH